jgi:hypothetical protein
MAQRLTNEFSGARLFARLLERRMDDFLQGVQN